jgi:ligand-binding sensor domain-containing protein/ribosomal protein L27
MKKAAFLVILLHLICCSLFSQEYSYTHYDITDGLAGSTVYCITQDKDGFLWMGTETGVSRFDGVHFKNFTTGDGLPDIEVLQIFGDSKGRVWMAPLKKSVCYYYKGRIYNQENDSLLRQIRLKGNVESFAEDDDGNILIQERTALHQIGANGSVSEYDSIGHEPLRECLAVCRNLAGHFQVQAGQKIFNLSEKGFSLAASIKIDIFNPTYIAMNPEWVIWRQDNKNCVEIRSLINAAPVHRPFYQVVHNHITYSLVGDSLAFFNEADGAKEYNIHTGQIRIFLPGREVSRTYRDVSGSLWFTTLGQGIYRLNFDEFRTIDVPTGDAAQTAVYFITKIENNIWLGNNHNQVYKLSSPDHGTMTGIPFNEIGKNRILYIDEENDKIFHASDVGVLEMTKDFHIVRRKIIAGGVKSVFKKNDKEYLMSTSEGLGVFDLGCFCMTDTLWRERSAAVYSHADTTYVGTLNGLYRIHPDKSIVFMGEKIPFLKKRISSIAASGDHILWIASYDDAGIIAIKNDSVVARITRREGLTSDICRVLYIRGNTLWVGTDKGLNKVELDKPGYPVTRYTSNDGLGSDIVNTIYADGPTIYVGTSSGMSFFNEAKPGPPEQCRLQLLAVLNAGNDRIGDSARMQLSYKKSDIRFEFVGISYRSVGRVRYRYRMLGLDSDWRETNETYLEYPTLPSGHYQFQLQAENKFAIRSSLLTLPFDVTTPYWQTIWFEVLVLVVFLSLTWLLVSRRIRHIRRQQDESERLIRKTTEMENRALQAQMNPHFIFNCLNSIQQFVFDQDVLASNQYISGFAHLIRATLHNSSKSFISITDEVDYLSTYLSLEKMRFKEKMDYTIEVDAAIDKDNRFLPPMLIQPYIENSMRHGLRHKVQGQGHIRIIMRQRGTQLVVTVEDNGIGRKKALEYKSAEHIEYQSKGMGLTADRIKMISAIYGYEIDVSIEDIVADNGQAQGTRVVIHLPDF